MKKKPTEWNKISENHMYYKELIFKIYKETTKSIAKKKFLMGRGTK